MTTRTPETEPVTLESLVAPEAALFRKLAEVMGEVGRIEKRGRNEFHGYSYATELDLVEAVRQKLAERNVAILPGLGEVTEREFSTVNNRGDERASVITTARVAFTFVDGDTGAQITREWAGQGEDPADKGLYAAQTGALKYFLMKTFLIPTGDDPESKRGTDERAQGRQRQSGGKPGPASPKQVEYAKGLLKGKTVAVIKAYFEAVGARGPQQPVTEEAVERALAALSKSQASALIERIKDGPEPDPERPSDVPADAGEFEHKPDDGEGTPLEGAS